MLNRLIGTIGKQGPAKFGLRPSVHLPAVEADADPQEPAHDLLNW
jgi:hypothetical protein